MDSAGDFRTGRIRGLRACAIHSRPPLTRVRGRPKPTPAGRPVKFEQWRALLQLLARERSDPSDCYFGLWEGWGFPESAGWWSTFCVARGDHRGARAFLLVGGALSEAEIWGTPAEAGIWGRPEFSRGGTPAFVWPSDHTWCVAADVDRHWAGIGATVPTIERLVADRRLDAVAADPDSEQPAYRKRPPWS